MPVCAAGCDFFTDGAAVCTNMPEAAALVQPEGTLLPSALVQENSIVQICGTVNGKVRGFEESDGQEWKYFHLGFGRRNQKRTRNIGQ